MTESEYKQYQPIEVTFEPLEDRSIVLSLWDPVIMALEDEYYDLLEVDP